MLMLGHHIQVVTATIMYQIILAQVERTGRMIVVGGLIKTDAKDPGSECNYDHRCTFCAGWNHGFFNCRKRNKNKKFGGRPSGSPRKENQL